MAIKIRSNKAKHEFPQLTLIMGAPKIGKSYTLAKLPNALIVDLEGTGYDHINVDARATIENSKDMHDTITYFFSNKNTSYEYLVLDHLENLIYYLDQETRNKLRVEFSSDAGFNRGGKDLQHRIKDFMVELVDNLSLHKDKKVILVGHTKKDETGDKIVEMLNVDNKSEDVIVRQVDAIGRVAKNFEGVLEISFVNDRGDQFGSRNPFLAKYEGEFNWDILFQVAKGQLINNEDNDSDVEETKESKPEPKKTTKKSKETNKDSTKDEWLESIGEDSDPVEF